KQGAARIAQCRTDHQRQPESTYNRTPVLVDQRGITRLHGTAMLRIGEQNADHQLPTTAEQMEVAPRLVVRQTPDGACKTDRGDEQQRPKRTLPAPQRVKQKE